MKRIIKISLYLLIIILLMFKLFQYLEKSTGIFSNKKIVKVLNSQIDYFNVGSYKTEHSLKYILDNQYNNINYIEGNKPNIKNNNSNATKVMKDDKKDPIIYIYNTHHKEEYAYNKNQPYNIVPTVTTTSYMLSETLKKYEINSIVEEASVTNVLKKNKWKYAASYKVTKIFLNNAKKEYPSLTYFIDVHRDSVKRSVTTTTINGKNYAKILFLLGLENKDYEKNAKMIEYLDTKIKKQYPSLSRGIYKKKGKGVNGVYNQDFSPNCILIEFGGNKNTIEEVYNSVLVVADAIASYVKENNESK